jgi:hypothetical protein
MWPFRKKTKTQLTVQPEDVLQKLVGLGYFKYVSDRDRERVKQEVLASLRDGIIDSSWDETGVAHDRRGYPADMANLVRGGIGQVLTQLKPVLAVEGCRINSVVQHVLQENEKTFHFQVMVNGERLADLSGEIDDDVNFHRLAMQGLLRIGNGLLRKIGSMEYLVGQGWGPTGRIRIFTDEMLDYLIGLQGYTRGWYADGDLYAC